MDVTVDNQAYFDTAFFTHDAYNYIMKFGASYVEHCVFLFIFYVFDIYLLWIVFSLSEIINI